MADRIVWPSWLPKVQSTSYSYQTVDRRAKSDMEIGGILRNEFDTDETRLQCRLVLDPDQAAFFEAFQKQILKSGTVWFELPILIGGEIKNHIVRFAEHPKLESLMGVHAFYSLNLQIDRRILMPEWLTEILLWISPVTLRWLSNRLHEILHIQIPGTLDVPRWEDY